MIHRFEEIKERLTDIIKDVYLHDENDTVSFKNNLKSIYMPRGRRLKVVAALAIFRQITPKNINQNIKDRLNYNFSKIPFNLEQFEEPKRIGRGGMNQVFLFQSKDQTRSSVVIKIPHRNESNIFEGTRLQKYEYEEVLRIFNHIPNFILPEEYLIIHSFKGDVITRLVIQEFIVTRMRDVVAEIEPNELRELLQENPDLYLTMKAFLEVFTTNETLLECQLDIMGVKNLSIIDTDQGPRMILMDPHFISPNFRTEDRKKRILANLKYLADMINEIEK